MRSRSFVGAHIHIFAFVALASSTSKARRTRSCGSLHCFDSQDTVWKSHCVNIIRRCCIAVVSRKYVKTRTSGAQEQLLNPTCVHVPLISEGFLFCLFSGFFIFYFFSPQKARPRQRECDPILIENHHPEIVTFYSC